VTELSSWGRGTLHLPGTLRELESRRVSVIAMDRMDGIAFLGPSYGRMMATVLAGIAELIRDPSLGRAGALRRAEMALLDERSHPALSHPSAWAPFVVVGEGETRAPAGQASAAVPCGLSLNPEGEQTS